MINLKSEARDPKQIRSTRFEITEQAAADETASNRGLTFRTMHHKPEIRSTKSETQSEARNPKFTHMITRVSSKGQIFRPAGIRREDNKNRHSTSRTWGSRLLRARLLS